MRQELLVVAAAFVAGVTVYSVLRRVHLTLSTAPGQLLAGYIAAQPPPDLVERFGAWLLHRFPVLTAYANVGRNRRWLALEGIPPTPAAVLGLATLLALGGLLLAALTAVPATVLIGALGFVYPFVRLRRRANQIRRMVLRALPELAALMAAEMAAGNPPDKALERAATWGGVLSALIGEVLEASRTNNRPVFGRGERPGMLVEVVTRYDLPALRAFATQIDLAARKGAAGPELMESLARTLIIEYKERALREAEALDNRLAVPAVVFFFLPFLFLLLAPLIVPLLRIL
jgi:Flp pilus assembly protein TadB